jgi:hypothetical protein
MFIIINVAFLMKIFKILTSIPQNILFYNTKTLCHHVEHTHTHTHIIQILISFWLEYEVIITNIIIHTNSFLVKLGVLLQTCTKALETNNQFCNLTFKKIYK